MRDRIKELRAGAIARSKRRAWRSLASDVLTGVAVAATGWGLFCGVCVAAYHRYGAGPQIACEGDVCFELSIRHAPSQVQP
jgi:hypothetical protein